MAAMRKPREDVRDGKRERLETRVTVELKELLQRAAELRGQTLTDFVLESARRAAEDVIHDHEVMTLSERDSLAFAEALLNPPAPNAHLRAAFDSYRVEVEEK